MAEVTRRRFLGGLVTLAVAPPAASLAAGCVDDVKGPSAAEPTVVDGWLVPAGTHLAPDRYAALAALLDVLVPGDETSPGATIAQAAYYVDRLLGAFDVDPPRIFAGGPYSGRHGGADGFSEWQPLTRIEELRWRTTLEGSRGIPEREWNGPVVGLEERVLAGLAQLDLLAQEGSGTRFALVTGTDARLSLVYDADEELVRTAYELAVEGTYGDPVYGGNAEQAGWTAIDYEGDRQPIGYTARQMARPEEG